VHTWKIILVGALLSAALIVTIAHNLKRDKTIADHVANSPQQVQQVSPMADPTTSPERVDTRKTSDIEPSGPVRAVDW
jgi:cytoskeletal protein RodZ